MKTETNSTAGGDNRLMSHFRTRRKQPHVAQQGVVVGGNGRVGDTGRGITYALLDVGLLTFHPPKVRIQFPNTQLSENLRSQ